MCIPWGGTRTLPQGCTIVSASLPFPDCNCWKASMPRSFTRVLLGFKPRPWISVWPQFSSVLSLSRVRLFAIPRTAAHQVSLSITNSRSLLKLMSIELVIPFNHLILCRSLLFPPSIFPRFAKSGTLLLTACTINRHQLGSVPGCSLWPLCVHWGNLVPLALSSLNFFITQGFSPTVPLLFTWLLLGRGWPYVFLHLLCSCGASHHPYTSYPISHLFKLLPAKDVLSLSQRRSHRILRWLFPNIT